MFVFYILVFIDIISSLPLSDTGDIMWNLKEIPAVFGQDIHLICHLPNDTTCCNDYRKWNVGNQYKLIIINGLSYNTTKYKEELKVNDKVSILTIFSLSEQDVNIPYECVYGFEKYRSVLELTEDVFEFHPAEKLPVTPTVSGHTISFTVRFKEIFPMPICGARLGMKNLTSDLYAIVRRNGLLYESSLAFSHSSLETECKDSLTVKCRIGKTELTVVDHKACSLSGAKETDQLSTIVVPIVVAVAILLIVVVICCVRRGFRQWRRVPKDDNINMN